MAEERDAKEPVVKKFGKDADERIFVGFNGPRGRQYNIVIHGDRMYVNGAEMLSNQDGPCEYAGCCIGNNEGCSRQRHNLDTEKEGCGIYCDRKQSEGYEWFSDKGWVKKEKSSGAITVGSWERPVKK
jgi:hypothetical protein